MDPARPDLAADDTAAILTPSAAASDPLISPSRRVSALITSPSDLVFDLDALLNLARRGQWRALLDAISLARSRHRPSLLPHHHLAYLSLSVLALCKLRRFHDAAADLEANGLDASFDDPRLQFESYPDAYAPGSISGSMVPFALRVLHADLSQRLGHRPVTIDRLYALLDFVRSKIHASTAAVSLWRRREAFVVAALCCNHFAHREYEVILALIRQLLELDPTEPVLLSRLGYVQLQIGDLAGARASFALVEASIHNQIESLKSEVLDMENLIKRNKALEFVVAKDYAAAVREYEECIERDPADIVAVNNKALCLMYSRDLSDSISVLEGSLERVPTLAVNEILVVNLCSMYELAYVNNVEKKRSLSKWIAQVAPDDFDSSSTRI